MSSGVLVLCTLFCIALAIPAAAQTRIKSGPVSKREVTVTLRQTQEIPELINRANLELIRDIKARGVDFALTKEEEWALHLQDASEELITTIRNALSNDERDRVLKESEQRGLYRAFVNNYGRTDVGSMQIAVTAGREYIRRYRSDPKAAQDIALIQRTIPSLENLIRRSYRPMTPVVTGRRRGN